MRNRKKNKSHKNVPAMFPAPPNAHGITCYSSAENCPVSGAAIRSLMQKCVVPLQGVVDEVVTEPPVSQK